MPPWALLTIAITSEVIATSALRASDGFRRPLAVLIMLVGYGLAFYLLSLVVRDLPIGLAYAIWAGAGTALIALVSVVAFDERLGPIAVLGIGLVIVGIALIHVSSL